MVRKGPLEREAALPGVGARLRRRCRSTTRVALPVTLGEAEVVGCSRNTPRPTEHQNQKGAAARPSELTQRRTMTLVHGFKHPARMRDSRRQVRARQLGPDMAAHYVVHSHEPQRRQQVCPDVPCNHRVDTLNAVAGMTTGWSPAPRRAPLGGPRKPFQTHWCPGWRAVARVTPAPPRPINAAAAVVLMR